MAIGSRKKGSSSILTVVLTSSTIAITTSVVLTGVLGADVGQNPSAEQVTADQVGATPLKTSGENGQGSASQTDIVTGAISKKKPRYLDAVYDPIHFKPAIDSATNEQCLSCHSEIMKRDVRKASPAGVKANDVLSWYQTLDTYAGDQETFHARHLTGAFAKKVMNLKCNFCHQGFDPRDEAAGSSATTTTAALGNFTLRKQVNPSDSCLRCHGTFPATNMGLEGSWHELREGLENEDTPNGCLTCHAEQFRTVRHQVNYLKAKAIEDLAKAGSSDTCYGCHGGRSWYRISYPYPRHAWPDMDPEVPEWAKNRPTESEPEYQLKK
jgi:hypothetical protein